MRKRFRSWLSSLLVALLLMLSVAPAMAATPPLGSDEAIALLQAYALVKGDTSGDLRLNDPITRAESATVFVRAMGAEELADMMKDTVPFADTKGHWAAGYVALSNRMGHMKGRDMNTFDPQANITNAEVLTVLLRIVGREPAGPWNATRIMEAAAELGLAPEGPAELLANLPATRGTMFRSLAVAVFTIPTADGKTIAQKNLDGDAPVLEVAAPATTVEEKVTVAGTVTDRSPVTVTVNGQGTTVVGGRFSATVPVNVGANTVTVVAKDVAGNESTKTTTVSRGGDVASIEVTGPTSVETGKSIELTITAKDAAGHTLPSTLVRGTVSSGSGSFDAAKSLFTAGSTPGKAKIVFAAGSATKEVEINILGEAQAAYGVRIRPVNGGRTVTTGKFTQIQVEIVDAAGNALPYDQGRTVAVTASGLDGMTVTPAFSTTIGGIATFTIVGTEVGEGDLEASSTGLVSDGESVTFTTSTHVVLTATPEEGNADGTTPSIIRAVLHNENGDAVSNSSTEDIVINLSAETTNSILTGSSLIIRRGATTSVGIDASVVPGFATEQVTVTGEIASSHPYSVAPAKVRFIEPKVGSASKMTIGGSYGTYDPATTGPLTLTVRVTDANDNVIPSGSFGFQVKVRTSNNEEKIDGIPDGLSLTIGDAGTPIYGAKDAVVGRTVDGEAKLELDYNKSGKVYLEVVGVAATDDAIADDGEPDSASSSRSMATVERAVTYAGLPHHLEVAVDLTSAKLVDQTFGILPANGSAYAKVKVYPVDAQGGRIPNLRNATAKLEKVSGDGTRLTGTTNGTARFDEGVAEFTVAAMREADIDVWKASATDLLPGLTPLPTVTIITTDEKPAQPEIVSIMGDSGYPNRITMDDTYMEINFTSITGPYPADTYGYVKVYRSGSSSPIYTSDVFELAGTSFVRVPKSLLTTKSGELYSISVNNGYNDSSKSFTWPQDGTRVTVESPITIDISSVLYDAETSTLTFRGGGFAGGEIREELLKVRNAKIDYEVGLGAADCTVSSSTATCTGVFLDAEQFEGNAVLMTEPGWFFKSSTGQSAEADEDLSDNLVTPMAYVSHAIVTFTEDTHSPAHVTGTVTLYGKNLNQGKIYLENLYFQNDPDMNLKGSSTTASASSSNSVTITLPNFHNTSPADEETSIAYLLKSEAGPDITLTAAIGWLDNGGFANGEINDIPVYTKLNVNLVQYDATNDQLLFTASQGGFLGGTVNPAGLVVQDRNGNLIVTLTAADTVVASYLTAGKLNNDREFRIQLSTETITALKADPPGSTTSWSNQVFISSLPNDISGGDYWFADANGWYANELAHGIYKLRW